MAWPPPSSPPHSASASAGINILLQQAVQLHQSGRVAEAQRLYDMVLAQNPKQGDALNLKSTIALDQNRVQEAVDLSSRAVAALPSHPGAHFNRANALAAAGLHQEALSAYRKAIALDSTFAGAYINAGVLLEKLGNGAEALTLFRIMVKTCPQDPRGNRNLALCLVKAATDAGDTRDALVAEALAAFARACALDPTDLNTWFDYGNLLAQQERHAEAVTSFEAALKLKPDWPEALSNMGESLRRDHRFDDAVAAQRKALAIRPGDTIILAQLGNALFGAKEYEEAAAIFRTLMADDPNALAPRINLGNTYREAGRFDDAMATFEDVLVQAPAGSYEAYGNLGVAVADRGWLASAYVINQKALSLNATGVNTRHIQAGLALTLGRFKDGWPSFEYRFDSPEEPLFKRPTPPPYWQGEDLTGKSILLWTEQGLGDEIVYASMIPEIVAHAGACVIACSKRMVPIFARAFPECAVVGYTGQAPEIGGGDRFDYQAATGSLGGYLRSDFQSFPRHQGYLMADGAKTADIRARYEALAQGRRIVGLSWRSKGTKGAAKSMKPLDLAPVLAVKNIFFVNLQYGDCAAELETVRAQLGIEVHQDAAIDPLQDMDAFFAQVAAMDLVVTTSNTTAHVAGAQGVPVWVLLPLGKGVFWYWFHKRRDSVLYPSARLLRPSATARERPWWPEVVDRAARQLAAEVSKTSLYD